MRTIAAAILVILAVPPTIRGAQRLDQLQEADRLAWLTNWYDALPIYAAVEESAVKSGNRRDAMYGRFGRLRGQMQTLSLPDLSEQIAADLESTLAKQDRRLRLRGLTVKADIDLEWDVLAAERDWLEVRHLARELGDAGWENRANGELGIVAFLKGNTGEATRLVQQAYQVAEKTGDVGGQLRYMGTIANGLLLAGYSPLALGFVDRALKFSNEHPEAGFAFVVYSTKVLTHLALKQYDEAERFAKTAMAEARAGDRRIKEIELSLMLAEIADARGRPEEAMAHLEQAVTTARAGGAHRLLAEAESDLADVYRQRGDLNQALRHAAAAVADTRAAGTRFTLPVRMKVLAEIHASQGRVAEANRVYDQATDIVEGIMVNVPSREAQARLVGVTSDIYTGHFRLVADRLNDPVKAYDVIERARGRAVADVLRTLPEDAAQHEGTASDHARAIARLQVRLMRAQAPAERRQLLDHLWEAEQRSRARAAAPPIALLVGGQRASVRTLQQALARNELVLEYVLTEPHSYCLVISRGRITIAKLPSKAHIEALTERFTQELRNGKADTSSTAKELRDAILLPIPEWQAAQRLVVVPDGKLHLLPLDALFEEPAGKSRIVSTVPSANVFVLLRNRRTRATPERALLGVGGVPYDRMFGSGKPAIENTRPDEARGLFDASYPTRLPMLPMARSEVLTAARLLGPTSVTLTGDQASETALKAQPLPGFDVIHFAVHAFAEPKFPERAALVLLNSASAGDDGLLQPREIGQFRLNAGVVVLSACDTAVGPTLGQEGVLNIARAFLLAGARSVITTLWAVSDTTSTALMRRFYENLAAGQDVAEALTRSKATVIEQFGSDARATVAAFQIVGVGDHAVARQGTALKTARSGQVQ
jgi:CHAT domain-containing protein/tetratricopeptide (TPR) repeat protein